MRRPPSLLVNSDASFDSAIKNLRLGGMRWIVDTETTGLRVHKGDRVIGIAVRNNDRTSPSYYMPFRHDTGRNLRARHLDQFNDLLSSTKRSTGWNYGFDIKMMAADGAEVPPGAEDVMLAAHLLDENSFNFKLKNWAKTYLDPKANEAEMELIDLLASRGLSKGDMRCLAPEEVVAYATDDVFYTGWARRKCVKALRQWKLYDLWQEVNEYMLVTVAMEQRGILLDVPLIKRFIKEAKRESKKAERVVMDMAGYEINLGSPKQICRWLDVPSSAKEALEGMAGRPEVDALLKFRQWQRVLTAYYNKYLELMDEDHILYPNIKLTGTVSGRPSAEDPNLQAIPRKTDVYKVKYVLRARPGFKIVSADYAQAELRLAAHDAKDGGLKRVFASGGDPHQNTADMIKRDRDYAKRINFGAVYNLGAKGLAPKIKKTEAEARALLDTWHNTFFMIKRRSRQLERRARDQGYIRLWTGRVRRYYSQRYPEPHKAFSNRIQGGVAEIMRLALTRLHRECYRKGGRLRGTYMLLQVHDNIVFEVPDHLLDKHVPVIREIMEGFDFTVPMLVDISIGPTFGDTIKQERGQ